MGIKKAGSSDAFPGCGCRRNVWKMKLAACLLLLLVSGGAYAQFTNSEIDPIRMKWSVINTRYQRIVFPRDNYRKALLIGNYIDTLSPYITRGLSNRLEKFPVLIHPEGILSNGMVTWAPKRMELITMPATDNFATQWIKQLTVHEYRHVAQMSTLNVGFTKAASYVLGQVAPGLISAFLPGYFLEGDAVWAETNFSTVGRGRQPGFSIEYRAILNENVSMFWNADAKRLNLNKMILGSYKDYVPDKYKTGFYLVGASTRYYGVDFWRKVVEYTGRYPFTIVPVSFAFKKYANTTTKGLAMNAFFDLRKHWAIPSSVENSTTVVPARRTSYTQYRYTLPFNDSLLVVMKSDFDKSNRVVILNRNTAQEQVLFYTGYVTSRPIIKDNRLFWTEYQPSKSWGQLNFSVVRTTELAAKENGTIKHGKIENFRIDKKKVFYVTAIGNDGFAMLEYDDQDNPRVLITDKRFRVQKTYSVPWTDCSFNGLTWDNKTGTLAAIIMNNEGMWIGRLNTSSGGFEQITRPSYVTVNDLTASDGKLYFTSSYSGKDEVHCYDLASGREYRLTESRYGTISSSVGNLWSQPQSRQPLLLSTTYTSQGYAPSYQQNKIDSLREVFYSYKPNNALNLEADSLSVINLTDNPPINLDSIDFAEKDIVRYPAKKYRKTGHLFSVHSWLPIYLDPDKLMSENVFSVGWGASVQSQNLLSTMTGSASIGELNGIFAVMGKLTYKGLPVHISGFADYGGGYQKLISYDSEKEKRTDKRYFSAGGTLSLPLNFSLGANNRFLTASVGLAHYNTVMEGPGWRHTGIQKLTFSLSYQSTKTTSKKDLYPRLGYYLQAYTAVNPFYQDFGSIYGLYAAGYFPGVAKNQAYVLRANYQYQTNKTFNFNQKPLFPTGAYSDFPVEHLFSVSNRYEAPVWYPDWGLGPIIYFRRITAVAIGDYAYAIPSKPDVNNRRHYYTYGGGFLFDVNVFRFSPIVKVGFILYKTNTYNGMGAQFVLNVAL